MTRQSDPPAHVVSVDIIEAPSGAFRSLRVACPHCNRTHWHGGGHVSDPVVLGHRVSHCQRGGGYWLVGEVTE